MNNIVTLDTPIPVPVHVVPNTVHELARQVAQKIEIDTSLYLLAFPFNNGPHALHAIHYGPGYNLEEHKPEFPSATDSLLRSLLINWGFLPRVTERSKEREHSFTLEELREIFVDAVDNRIAARKTT